MGDCDAQQDFVTSDKASTEEALRFNWLARAAIAAVMM